MIALKSPLSDEELIYILETQLPDLLDRRPELRKRLYHSFLDVFARHEEIAAVVRELRALRSDFDDFRQETSQRFDQVDSRLDKVEGRLDQMDQRFQDLKDWVEMVVGRFQVRSGRNLENVVAGALRVALKRPDIRPESIMLRQKIVDEEGVVFPKGRQKEVDLIASDSEYTIFEVKSAAEVEDVDNFAEKVQLFQHLHPEKTVEGVFITLAPQPDVQERCRELGIVLAR